MAHTNSSKMLPKVKSSFVKSTRIYTGILALSLLVCITASCNKPENTAKPNILLIMVDDLRPELKSFGVDYMYTPHMDQLAQNGLSFHQHYVNAPSCGPSRYTFLTGKYGPRGNYALFERAEKIKSGSTQDPSMPEWFRSRGYTTVSVGKVSHHPGGLGGAGWNDSTEIEMPEAWDRQFMPVGKWQHPRGAMHGLANGEIRVNPQEMDVFQSAIGDDAIYPDGLITDKAIEELNKLAHNSGQPFLMAVGIIKPHLPFGAPEKYFQHYKNSVLPPTPHPTKPEGQTTWHGSGEFNRYNLWGKNPNEDADFGIEVRKHYAAAVTYADAQVGKILAELKQTGADKNTIVVLWGDHGWHLGEHGIWGKHSLFEESLRSPLIISVPDMENQGGISNSIVESLDIFPTLCELAGVEIPDFAQGESLIPILKNPNLDGKNAVSYWQRAETIRTKEYRLIQHEDGFVELYDHKSEEKENKNIASEQPDTVRELQRQLQARLN